METIIKIPKDSKHKIVIPNRVWEVLGLKPGEYIKINIEKIEVKHDDKVSN